MSIIERPEPNESIATLLDAAFTGKMLKKLRKRVMRIAAQCDAALVGRYTDKEQYMKEMERVAERVCTPEDAALLRRWHEYVRNGIK